MDSKRLPTTEEEKMKNSPLNEGEGIPTSSNRKRPRSKSSSKSEKRPEKKADGLKFSSPTQKEFSVKAEGSNLKQPPSGVQGSSSQPSELVSTTDSAEDNASSSFKSLGRAGGISLASHTSSQMRGSGSETPATVDRAYESSSATSSINPMTTQVTHAISERSLARLGGGTTGQATTQTDSAFFVTNQPRAIDVLFGRGRQNRDHPGNRWMQLVVDIHGDAYYKANREKKTAITKKIVQIIKKQGSRFLKYDKKQNQWKEVSNDAARDKVGHAMRDGRARPMESSLDLTLFDGLFTIPRELREAVERMISLKQNDAHATFGPEEANILSGLLSSSSQSSPEGAEGGDRKPPATEGPGV